jgi:hypothetical protein
MMWFKRWLYRMVDSARELELGEMEKEIIVSSRQGTPNSNPNLMFKIYRAANGFVMEVGRQDRRTHDTNYEMYLIADGDDLGDSISKIITVETLRI